MFKSKFVPIFTKMRIGTEFLARLYSAIVFALIMNVLPAFEASVLPLDHEGLTV